MNTGGHGLVRRPAFRSPSHTPESGLLGRVGLKPILRNVRGVFHEAAPFYVPVSSVHEGTILLQAANTWYFPFLW